MRFAELRLLRYGHFEDCNLIFPRGDCDLHIVLGPNEAGKSTALAAVSDLLFGFGARTRFAFKFKQPLLRVGAVLENDGASAEIVRRKGTGDTLSGADEHPLSEQVLAPLLAGQTRESFRRMFGLDHAQLRLGGEQIVKAEDDIGAAIFSAGSGLTQVSRVCEAIEEEAKAIWASRAGESRRYNAAAAAYQTARSILKASEVRPSAWLSARRELEGAGAALAKLRQDHARLTQEQRGVQRRQLVLPAATRRALAQSRLAELQQAPILSEEGAAACEAALADRERAQLLIAGAKAEIERLESELERAQPNPALLELADEIAALAEAKGQVDQGRGQMPELEGRRAQLRLAAGDLARELGWAHDDITQFRAKMPSRASLLALRELLDRRISIDEQAKGAREAARTAAALEARLRESVAGLPNQPDVRQIQELVREIRGAGLHRALDQAARTASELESELAARVRDLAPWSGDVKALQSLQLPQDADVDHALQALQGASERASTEADAVRRSAERLSSLALDRKHAVLAHPAPTRQVLEEARRGGRAHRSGSTRASVSRDQWRARKAR